MGSPYDHAKEAAGNNPAASWLWLERLLLGVGGVLDTSRLHRLGGGVAQAGADLLGHQDELGAGPLSDCHPWVISLPLAIARSPLPRDSATFSAVGLVHAEGLGRPAGALVDDMHFSTRLPKHLILGALVNVADRHREEVEAEARSAAG